jgi:dTDP-4-dehydrorhamnose reductase
VEHEGADPLREGPIRRLLITGANGQLGTALAEAFAGDEITGVDLDSWDVSLPAPVWLPEVDVVLHAAAWTNVDGAEDDPQGAAIANVGGTQNVAAIGKPLVYYSTDYVFDGTKAEPYTEADPPGPVGVYGASKLAGEVALHAAQPRSVTFRTAWVCSAHGNNFVKTMLRLGKDRPELRVVADQHGAPTFADDLADAAIAILPRLTAAPAGDPAFGIYHLSGQPFTTWHGFAASIFAGAAARGQAAPTVTAITTADYPTRARRPANSRLDCSRAARILGVEAADWRQGLDRCLDALMKETKA